MIQAGSFIDIISYADKYNEKLKEIQMDVTAKNAFKALVQKIFELPLWIKHIIYLELKEEFESSSAKISLNFIRKEDSLQLYVPKMTFIGKKELETKSKGLSISIYKFLEGVTLNLSIIEIAINNGWSLAECSTYLLGAMNAELLIHPDSTAIKGTALYMSGNIRLGEYFVKLGKISIEQLDEGLRTQKYIEESVGDKTGLGEILINLGFVTKADTEGILLLKEDCKKRYIPDITSSISVTGSSSGTSEQIAQLTRENNQLKDQIRKILRIGQ